MHLNDAELCLCARQLAAFMGCESGEIEVGMSMPAGQMNFQAGLNQIFSEDFFQQSLLEELLQLPPTRPSSSSSSLPSISVGSPVDGSTSLQRTMAMSSSTTTSPRELTAAPLPHPPRPPHPVPFSRHGPGHVHGHVHFPSPEADDVAMAQAMLAVISASSSSSSAMPTTSTPPLGYRRAHRSPRRGSTTTAFRAYNAALAPRAPRRASDAPGQRMIKMGISILRKMHTLNNNGQERTTGATTQQWREEDEEAAAPPAPTSSQLHHMISERRRRERLNESFEALRGLLPPGSKVRVYDIIYHEHKVLIEYINICFSIVFSNIFMLIYFVHFLSAERQSYRPRQHSGLHEHSDSPDFRAGSQEPKPRDGGADPATPTHHQRQLQG